jgi:hypothetical protein
MPHGTSESSICRCKPLTHSTCRRLATAVVVMKLPPAFRYPATKRGRNEGTCAWRYAQTANEMQ